MIKCEVLVKCLICKNEKWVVWDRKKDSLCYSCPYLSDSPPVMIPQIIPQLCEAVATLYVTREAE